MSAEVQAVANSCILRSQWCPEMWDLTFLDKFRALPNMNLLLNTWFVSCELDQSGSITVSSACSHYTKICIEVLLALCCFLTIQYKCNTIVHEKTALVQFSDHSARVLQKWTYENTQLS